MVNKILEPGKLVKRTAAEVSVRQIEIADDRCIYLDARCFARVENILLVCLYRWFNKY